MGAAVVTLVIAMLTLVAVWPGQHAPRDSAALRQVVALAAQLSPIDGQSGGQPVAVDAPHTLLARGQSITVRSYSFDGRIAIVATSPQPFAMPSDAQMTSGGLMPWSIVRGGITAYCPRADVLLAGPETPEQLAALASALHLT